MPKKVKQVLEARTTSKRAASKEALKQMQRLSKTKDDDDDEPETLEILSEEEVTESPSKKKYKVCNKRTSDGGNERNIIVLKSLPNEPTLNLQIWQEPLSDSQADSYYKRQMEFLEMNEKIDNLLKSSGAEIVFEGDSYSVFEMETQDPIPTVNSNTTSTSATTTTPAITTISKTNGTNVVLPASAPNAISIVVDPKLGSYVTSLPSGAITIKTAKKRRVVTPPPATPPVPVKIAKTGDSGPPPLVSLRVTEPTPAANTKSKSKSVPSVVDLTSDDKPSADSKEVSFNKLQGKTFPSLVVVARPNLKTPSLTASRERAKLDTKVKSLLMLTYTKFTEWLIQQGLVRAEQNCTIHTHNKLKLGMYSDVSKFPFSGGYIWIAECCPQRFVSVFNGSLFEGSPHSPSAILKLIYHWACQTNVQNVVQWVKVENLYVKGLYTWLRSVCTVALHTHVKQLGGPGVRVEIGVISLGTTSQDGNQRQVKVEVLGILETETDRIRLRAVEPSTDRNYKKRFSQILEPLSPWVHPDSILVTDLTVDKNTLHSMGFLNVAQTHKASGNSKVMDYLRRIVPRMFQNTLSLLSRQIIQQFLDELVWREWFGHHAAEAFDNLLAHLAEQTRADTGLSLTVRLNKVAGNPFKNWNVSTRSSGATVTNPSPKKESHIDSFKKQRRKQLLPREASPTPDLLKVAKTTYKLPDELVNLDSYYFGVYDGTNELQSVTLNIKCHVCKETFHNNIKLMRHYFRHAHSVNGFQCHYCLTGVPSKEALDLHIRAKHRQESRIGNDHICIICDSVFYNVTLLGKHMQSEHSPAELPYQCGSCTFRTSNHKHAIDHFNLVHNGHGVVQCPFCLRSTIIVNSQGRNAQGNLNTFLQHLQKHQRKAVARKCHKCCLWFIHKEGVMKHQKMHESQRNKLKINPWPISNSGIMVPKSMRDVDEIEEDEEEDNVDISNVSVTCKDSMLCMECGEQLNEYKHFPSIMECDDGNCNYKTCCKAAYTKHAANCKTPADNTSPSPLPCKMFCICGFSETNGNIMANHLAICEKKSAYPSEEAAKAATITHSMLDVLGLIRKSDDQTPEVSEAAVSDSESARTDSEAAVQEETSEKSPCTECDVDNEKAHTKKPVHCKNNGCTYNTRCTSAMDNHTKECPKSNASDDKTASDDKPASDVAEDKQISKNIQSDDTTKNDSTVNTTNDNDKPVNNDECLDELLTNAQKDILDSESEKVDWLKETGLL